MRSGRTLWSGRFGLGPACVALAVVALAAPGLANVNLEWRPAVQTVNVGDTVEIGLYAVSDNGVDQAVTAMNVLLSWNPTYLGAVSCTDNGPYPWASSCFPAVDPWHLNQSLSDGDALYMATRQVGQGTQPAWATPQGLLVTTVEIEALAATPPGGPAVLTTPATLGTAATKVLDGVTPGLDVHGTLGSATIEIVPEPSAVLLIVLGYLILRRR